MTAQERFMAKVSPEPMSGCWLWEGSTYTKGYGTFWFGKLWAAHRLAYTWWRGEIPSNAMVCHSCDTPACVNPAHLWLGSHRANMADRNRKNRQWRPAGERAPKAKLANDTVRVIRQRAARGESDRALASEYGLHVKSMRRVIRGQVYQCA